MTLTPGTRLGPYEILAPLGAGGMGEVYRARDTRLDRTVAIKILPEALAADAQFRERFDREARAISQLTHPHICTLYDVGRHEGTDYLVMEHLEGQTLADRLMEGALPLDQALQLAIQIADALSTAHRRGIVHRDLKPGNIMLVRRGGPSGLPAAKLLDFGLAKVTPAVIAASGLSMAPTGQTPMTMQGTILGTLQYMAPEQIEGQDADARTDIFAFGCVLYEMLTGRKAFEGKTQASLISAILKDIPPPVSKVQPLTPASLDRLVTTCLAKDPDDRWQTARDLLRELQWVAAAGAQAAAPTATEPGTIRRSRERFAWIVAVTCLAMTALAVPATLYFRSAVPEPLFTRLDVVTPPTVDTFSFALSPDGRQLAFVANGEKGSQLWLRPLDQATAQPLAGTDGANLPFWAPDSRAVAFFAAGKLKRIDLGGGAPEVVADAGTARGGTWNRDGVIVFGQASPGALMRVSASGGTPVPVTRVATGQGSHRWPQFLPDGHHLLFSMAGGGQATNGIYVASLDGGEPTRVLLSGTAGAYGQPGFLLLVRQGVLFAQRFDPIRATLTGEPIPLAQSVGTDDGLFHSALSVSETGVLAYRTGAAARRQHVWVDRTGKRLGTLGEVDENVLSGADLAPDGSHVAAYRSVQGNTDVWLMDVRRGVWSRLTFDAATDRLPIWSPDGSRIAFETSRQGADIFEKQVNGAANERPLVVSPQPKTPLDWSPDGRVLLYASLDSKTQADIWAVSLAGDAKPVPVVQTMFDDVQGQFSPDGQWVVYVSNESGRYEVYVQPFPGGGGKWQVSTAGGVYPRWRRDGREIYYVDPDNRLVAVPIQAAANARTVDVGVPTPLFSTRLAVGANIFTTGINSRTQYAVAADGRFLMNVQADDTAASPITIVQNWTAELKK